MQDGDWIFLAGNGASPTGDYPFLDRLNLRTLEFERLFRAEIGTYEAVVAPLNETGTRWVTRYETKTKPPNYRIRELSGGKTTALTAFTDPTPQLRGNPKAAR